MTESVRRNYNIIVAKTAVLDVDKVAFNPNTGADKLCSRFATGGGARDATEINQLPENELPQFMQAFDEAFSAA